MVLLGDGLSSFAGHGLVGIDIGQNVRHWLCHGFRTFRPWGGFLPSECAGVFLVFDGRGGLVFLYRTRPGLALRAAGEKPSAVDVVGWNVFRIRYLAVLFGAGMAGLAGAFLSVAYLSTWAEGMTAGRGWVALALVIFAGWHPIKLLGGAYLFGFAYILIAQSQVLGGVSI